MSSTGDHPADAEFVSEPIAPRTGSARRAPMARGEPGLPASFTWRGRVYEVQAVLASWKRSEREGHTSSGSLYLRRHYYTVRTTTGEEMTLYCLRHARAGRPRWFLYILRR